MTKCGINLQAECAGRSISVSIEDPRLWPPSECEDGGMPISVMITCTDQGFGMAFGLMEGGLIGRMANAMAERSPELIIREDSVDHEHNAPVCGKTCQSVSRRESMKEPQRVGLLAPSAACYAELTATGDSEGLLQILLTKPGPGRPTQVASVPLRDQPLAILLAGIETATNRMRQGAEDLPDGRLPEEIKITLEWSNDSLAGHVRGTPGARRKAMNRLRYVVQFQDGIGLVSHQDSNTGTWSSTIPFRLRTSGKL